jgi:hypothetical protein
VGEATTMSAKAIQDIRVIVRDDSAWVYADVTTMVRNKKSGLNDQVTTGELLGIFKSLDDLFSRWDVESEIRMDVTVYLHDTEVDAWRRRHSRDPEHTMV